MAAAARITFVTLHALDIGRTAARHRKAERRCPHAGQAQVPTAQQLRLDSQDIDARSTGFMESAVSFCRALATGRLSGPPSALDSNKSMNT